MVGHDSIAMDAPVGGAILNRHQLPFADLALQLAGHGGVGGLLARGGRATGPTTRIVVAPGELALDPRQTGALDAALTGMGAGGLDALFARVRTPHFMARGGAIVAVPGFPGERANRSILDEIASIHGKYGLTLTDAYGPGHGHKSPGHNVTGTAADFAGPDKAMDAAVRDLVRAGYLVGYDGRFGSQAWPGHGPSYVAGANAHLHVELGGTGSVTDATPVASPLPRVKIRGGGQVGRVAQRSLDLARRGAQRLADSASSAGGPDAPGSGGKPANAGQIRSWLRSGLRLAGVPATAGNIDTLFGRVMQESGGDPRAQNNWDSNAKAGHPSMGFLQTIRATFERWKVRGHNNIWNPVDNSAAAIRYMLGTYGRLVGSSGTGYAKGGRVGPVRKALNAATAVSSRLNTPRIAQYDAIVGDRGTVPTLNRLYQQADARFSLTDEVFINEETGELDEVAIKQRAGELLNLAAIRGQVIEQLERAREIGRRIMGTYNTVISRLTRALPHARTDSQRGKLQNAITAHRGNLKGWGDKLYDLGFDIQDAYTDRDELGKQYAEVTGTKPNLKDPVTPTLDSSLTPEEQAAISHVNRDTAESGLTADTGDDEAARAAGQSLWQGILDRLKAAGAGDDVVAAAAQQLAGFLPKTAAAAGDGTASGVVTSEQIAQGVAAAFASFQSSRGDVFAQFGSNARTGYSDQHSRGEAEGPGVRAYGALGGAQAFEGGAPGHTVINNFAAPPPDPHTWAREQEFELKAL
jgi:hypothetical protein